VRLCSVEGCGKKHLVHGFCKTHEARRRHQLRRADPTKRAAERDYERQRIANYPIGLVGKLLEVQNGVCAMQGCGRVLVEGRGADGLCADHDHGTGHPRGLLCRSCNAQLGHYEKIKAAAEVYLQNPPAKAFL
jgi:hypothetical protein